MLIHRDNGDGRLCKKEDNGDGPFCLVVRQWGRTLLSCDRLLADNGDAKHKDFDYTMIVMGDNGDGPFCLRETMGTRNIRISIIL